VIRALARVTVTLLYVPAGTVVNVPRYAESLCRRVSSTIMGFVPKGLEVNGKENELPVAGLSAIPVMVALNERIEEFAGGVSIIVRLSVAFPPPPPPPPLFFLGRLHDRSAVASGRAIHTL